MKKKQWISAVALALLAAGAFAMIDREGVASTPTATEAAFSFDAPSPFQTSDTPEACETSGDDSFLMACNCRDLCRNDLQCGPGGSCVPVGPCGCRQCAATE